MYTLFGFKGSGSAAVECALEMTGADYRIVEAASWEHNDALAELERVNPLKQIPTLLLEDGTVLTESAAILMHLGFAFPQSGLLSETPGERDLVLRGLVYIAANCYSCISVIDYPERYTSATDDAARQAVKAGATDRLHQHWDIFADLYPVADERFIAGEQPGALDLLAAVVSKWSGTRKHVKTSRPAFSALLERIESHPAVALVFGRHWQTLAQMPTGA
ncbi:glutathione S-transferase family protein [Scleromatobacter humisilvae]|uniref:Glutathione S-transferase family protein n=1 Tax=Scleromatobacter humisilvae TaxID=2897159 RepID=A0A9X1YSA4_9BURK|nr:glutathione S-transferase family protein [Scleromatobacter humisilvae]MCK9688146.1 glutathione S-transferase family protein [Scleromatobacter humisilvae]